ncbi:ricin-type beta-trefoil lectin domain protein [Saccharothrix sp. BKS2]|uniref:RICIN domain-containing protein n=1 Tax=Saccharothrix sp. BKS2 TaxID=3064400 RepID=UPI0039EB9612
MTAVLTALWCTLALMATGTASAEQYNAQYNQGVLMNTGAGLCLNVVGYSAEPGSRTEIWGCSTVPAEQWVLNESGQMYNPASGLCLNTVGYSVNRGAATELWGCNNRVALWSYWESSSYGSVLLHRQSGYCLNVKAYAQHPGARTEIWTCANSTAQDWKWRV